uniref:Auxin response factor n=1 Tax=Ananas comosus var. bracteatus TaxID=296719 RepID=A0A6V7Q6I1_ANACO|nr:unnamed protein product [Ananas comosus var. bracteatus]
MRCCNIPSRVVVQRSGSFVIIVNNRGIRFASKTLTLGFFPPSPSSPTRGLFGSRRKPSHSSASHGGSGGPAAGSPDRWIRSCGWRARARRRGFRRWERRLLRPRGPLRAVPRAPDLGGVGYDALVLCRVVGVRYLANPHTDEVFAVIALEPGRLLPPRAAPGGGSAAGGGGGGGGWCRSRRCSPRATPTMAEGSPSPGTAPTPSSPLDMSKDPPVQYLSIRDVHGGRWEFRHIYRGTPRRHLLTTGWSIFVNAKKLVAGDVVVFARNEAKELFVGIRRAYRSFPKPSPATFPHREIEDEPEPENVRVLAVRQGPGAPVDGGGGGEAGEARASVRGDVLPEAGAAEFVVPKEAVDASLMVNWSAGIRVRMPVETEDSSRMTWFQGTVEEIMAKDMGQGPSHHGIDWDEKEALKDVKKNVKHGVLFTPLLNYTTSPAGMQGARHDLIFLPGLSTPSSITLKDSSPQNQGSILDSKAQPFKAPASGPREDNEEQVEFSFRLFGQLLKSIKLSNRVDLQLAQVWMYQKFFCDNLPIFNFKLK